MASSPVVKVSLTYQDRDNNRADITTYCAFTTPILDAYAFALDFSSRVESITDANLIGINMAWRWTIDDPGIPAESSNIARKILMLILNEDEDINGIMIPSPSDNWETTGNYAGIRLDLASAGALAFSAMLASLDLRTDDNRALGTVLAAGGLAL